MNRTTYTFRDARMRSPLLRGVNALGSGLGAIGLRLPSLAPDDIIAAAQKSSHIDLPLDADTHEALEKYIASAESDSLLNTLGRMAVRNMLVDGLASRFSVLGWHLQHPELEGQQIKQPWIVVGLPRTGTSILSILLGLDPLNRPLLQWEAATPIPPSGLVESNDEQRMAEFSAKIGQLERLNPAVAAMHPFGSTVAEECTAVFTYALRTIGMETIAFVPSYGRWLDDADMLPAYRIHRQTLQALQQTQPTGHWVLKSPNHLWCLPALLNAYPDARVVWTHRDPAKVVPSLASLNCAMQTQFTRRLRPEQVGEYWAEKLERALEKAIAYDDGRDAGWCHHLQYEDLVAEPTSALAALYEHFGLTVSASHQERIVHWLSHKPQHADGIHAYAAADFGWSDGQLRDRFSSYQKRYEIPL